jgi:hypothetical protein
MMMFAIAQDILSDHAPGPAIFLVYDDSLNCADYWIHLGVEKTSFRMKK